MTTKKNVLFICLGNICRSPMAEGIFTNIVVKDAQKSDKKINYRIDSAGTGAWHIGNPPDSRAIKTLKNKGIDITNLQARQVTLEDFYEFDYIIAMDSQNYKDLLILKSKAEATAQASSQTSIQNTSKIAELHRMLDFDPNQIDDGKLDKNSSEKNTWKDVPDPYFGQEDGFELCYQMISSAAKNLKKKIDQA